MKKQNIIDMIREEDIEFIRLQFVDAFGNLKNIAVTPECFERVTQDSYPIASNGFFDDAYDMDEDLYLKPDLDTFVTLPWRPQQSGVGKFICDICQEDGSPFEMSPRFILKRVLEAAKKEGYVFSINPECEFFLFHTDENNTPTVITHEKAGYLDVGPADFGENARREMVLMLQEMGFRIAASHHEKAPAQHEISFSESEALKAADDLTTFKFAVRSIAKRFGLYATFLPKPLQNEAGSGLHLDMAVYKDGKNIFDEDETTARHFLGGVLKYAPEISAITNPTVNSYKRLLTGYQAPLALNWGRKGEKTLVKWHKTVTGSKLELRFPDPSANQYLAIAVCISAGLQGIREKLEPGEEYVTNCGTMPKNLIDAVRLFSSSDLVRETLGEEFTKIYASVKEQEWDEYMMQVSDWEIRRYLDKM